MFVKIIHETPPQVLLLDIRVMQMFRKNLQVTASMKYKSHANLFVYKMVCSTITVYLGTNVQDNKEEVA